MAKRSISHNRGLVQGERIELLDYGVKASFKVQVRGKQLDGVKRGKIKGWSLSSVRRLRETLLRRFVPDSQVVGVTLTLPWKGEVENIGKVFRACLNRFKVAFHRQFPHSALIYRVELQQRQMPHLHCIVFIAKADGRYDGGWWVYAWWRHGFSDLRDGSMDGYIEHGVKAEIMGENAKRLVQYLCDHTSKKKQSQMGWTGRQWGVIGGNNLVNRPGEYLPPFESPRHEGYFWRLVHRYTRYRVADKAMRSGFGWRYTKPRRHYGVTFGISPALAKKFWDAGLQHDRLLELCIQKT